VAGQTQSPNFPTVNAAQPTFGHSTFGVDGFVAKITDNGAPTVTAGGPYSVDEGAAVVVSASGADPENGPLSYAWDLDNDGSFETPGQSATFSAAALDGPSTVTISVRVTDAGGLTATNQATVEILNVAPTAMLNAPAAVDEGSDIQLSLTNPADPSGADTAAGFMYAFDCGSGLGYGAFSPGNSGACPTADNGTRLVKGRIRDKDGGETEYTAAVSVNNVAPTASFSAAPGTVYQGQAATLAFSDPFDPGAADTTAGFRFSYDCTGDGVFEVAGAAAMTYVCAYPAAGVFTARGRIEDKDGGYSDYTAAVTVLTPQQGIAGLIERIRDLVDRGVLNGGQGNALIAKLEAALRQLDRGKPQTAINQLEAFINQVNALIGGGVLPAEEGQPLLAAATAILAALVGP
jgi:hypothetical protein